MRSFGKPALGGWKWVLVSHDSHREEENTCVKQKVCVKSVCKDAMDKGLERAGTPQEAKVLEI
jgi:hypothetical protein